MSKAVCWTGLVLFTASCTTTKEVHYTLGDSEFYGGDSIRITSMSGSKEALEPGGSYTIRGTYRLSTKDAATLLLSATTNGPGEAGLARTVSRAVERGTGEFELDFKIVGKGYLHLTYYDPQTGRPFGGVYFGQAESVLEEKSWRYDDPTSESG